MSEPKIVQAYVATYSSEEDALADYAGIRKLDEVYDAPIYDIALVSKNEKGKLHIKKKEKSAKLGAWAGAAAGGLIGLVVPPVFLAEVALGAVTGGLIGHFARGMDHSVASEIGASLLAGEAAIVFADVSDHPGVFNPEDAFARAVSVNSYPFDVEAGEFAEEETAIEVDAVAVDTVNPDGTVDETAAVVVSEVTEDTE